MFGYAPQESDQSGRIIAQGMMGAAQTNAQTMGQVGQDIGGALTSLAAAYGQRQGTIAKGKNFKKFMGMAGDTFGMDGAMFGDMDDFDAGMMLENFAPMMPAMANAQLGQQRIGVQQGQQALTARMPDLRKQADAQNTLRQEGPSINGTALPNFRSNP
jgi:hypothetical protein